MEYSISGEVVCRGLHCNKELRKFSDKRAKEWLETLDEHNRTGGVQYRFLFEREGTGHLFTCTAVAHSQTHNWYSHDWGNSPSEALVRSLKQMRATSEEYRSVG